MKIDVFDFDDTIYDGDSSIDFYLYSLRNNKKIIKFLPNQILYFLKYKLKIVDKEKFKEEFFCFLKEIDNIDIQIQKFWDSNIKKIRYYIFEQSKNKKYIISASPEFLLQYVCDKIGDFKLIASKVNKRNGKFESKNCFGEEKILRLKNELNGFEIENFYSDSISDSYLANISNNSYLIKKNGRIVSWKK